MATEKVQHEQERRQRQKEESQEKKKQRLTEQGAVKVNCSKKKIYTGEKDKTYKEYYIQTEKAGNSNDNSRKKENTFQGNQSGKSV